MCSVPFPLSSGHWRTYANGLNLAHVGQMFSALPICQCHTLNDILTRIGRFSVLENILAISLQIPMYTPLKLTYSIVSHAILRQVGKYVRYLPAKCLANQKNVEKLVVDGSSSIHKVGRLSERRNKLSTPNHQSLILIFSF